ncbi:MAG TPA: PqqD family peptide modification chaperone [Coleofasciculaceae cyanobacterium]
MQKIDMRANDLISGTSLVTVNPNQVSSDLAGEAVILNLQSGTYYGLNAVGASIWSLIQSPTAIDQIRDALLQEYDVEPEVCDRDLHQILEDLYSVGLIEISHEQAA